MSPYRYKAITAEGVLKRGHQLASSSTELKVILREQGLSLISYSKEITFFKFQKVPTRALIDLCLYLEQFEKAGLALKDSLEELSHVSESSKLKLTLKTVVKDIEGGHRLSTALSHHPTVFDVVFVGLISVGEKTGRLSSVLEHLSNHLKWRDDIQAQTIKALRYPLIMALVLLFLIVVLMTVLVPELIVFIGNISDALPLSTRLLISLSAFLRDKFMVLFCLCVFFGGMLFILLKTHQKGFLWRDLLLSMLPLIGPIRRKFVLARFCHVFSILYESGIDILQAIRMSRQALTPGQISLALENVERFVREGASLSQAFDKIDCFPKIVIRIIKMGEETGELNDALHHVTDFFDVSLKRRVETVIGLIEPTLILCGGSIMAWIMVSIFLPLYDSLSLME